MKTGFLILVLSGFVVIAFQNCAPGFEVVSEASGNQTANVLKVNPYLDSGNDNLAFDANYSSFAFVAKLQNLQNAPYLTNGNIALDKNDGYPSAVAYPFENLLKPSDDPKFAQANVYYHLDRVISSMKQLGVFPSSYEMVHVNSHCKTGPHSVNNAYFDYSNRLLCMGYATVGGKPAWSAYDADVIVHEFSHSFNNAIATPSVLLSTGDMWALDEGFSDALAYLQNENPFLATWYGSALMKATFGESMHLQSYRGMRDMTQVPRYPADMAGEPHADGNFLSTIIFELSENNVPHETLKILLARILSNLQVGDNFGDAIRYLTSEGVNLGIDRSLILRTLQKRDLDRKDDVAAVGLAPQTIKVVDNHFLTVQAGGNCNNVVDAGETALIYVNLINNGPALGAIQAVLSTTAPASEISIPSGGEIGTYMHIKSNSDFLTSAFPSGIQSNNQKIQAIFSGFLIQASPSARGTYQFNLRLKGFNSRDGAPITKNLPVTLTVGTAALNNDKCANGREDAVWP